MKKAKPGAALWRFLDKCGVKNRPFCCVPGTDGADGGGPGALVDKLGCQWDIVESGTNFRRWPCYYYVWGLPCAMN